MEIFSAVNSRAVRQPDNTIYMEFIPSNAELADQVLHGMTLPISGSVAETIASYEAAAAREMFAIISRTFPGAYVLDGKYGE